jgi:hypothetical protein
LTDAAASLDGRRRIAVDGRALLTLASGRLAASGPVRRRTPDYFDHLDHAE